MDIKFAFAQTATEWLSVTTNRGNYTALSFTFLHTKKVKESPSILYNEVSILEVILQDTK